MWELHRHADVVPRPETPPKHLATATWRCRGASKDNCKCPKHTDLRSCLTDKAYHYLVVDRAISKVASVESMHEALTVLLATTPTSI